MECPDRYSLTVMPFTDKHTFRYYANYTVCDAMDSEDVGRLKRMFHSMSPEYPLFLSEEHLLLYLSRYGLQHCMKLKNGKKVASMDRVGEILL